MSKIAEMLRALDDRDMRFDLVLEECAKEDERRDAEIERLRAHIAEIEAWRQKGEDLVGPASSWGECLPSSTLFKLGNWWAERPWGKR